MLLERRINMSDCQEYNNSNNNRMKDLEECFESCWDYLLEETSGETFAEVLQQVKKSLKIPVSVMAVRSGVRTSVMEDYLSGKSEPSTSHKRFMLEMYADEADKKRANLIGIRNRKKLFKAWPRRNWEGTDIPSKFRARMRDNNLKITVNIIKGNNEVELRIENSRDIELESDKDTYSKFAKINIQTYCDLADIREVTYRALREFREVMPSKLPLSSTPNSSNSNNTDREKEQEKLDQLKKEVVKLESKLEEVEEWGSWCGSCACCQCHKKQKKHHR